MATTQVSLIGEALVDSDPLLTVGEAGGFPLYLVTGAALLSSDRLVIANDGSQSLVLFASDGRFLLEVGGPGDGPGEFGRIRSVHRLAGDTVAAWDPRAQRITVFDPAFDVHAALDLSAIRIVSYVHAIGSRGFLGISSFTATPQPNATRGFWRSEHTLFLVGTSGEVVTRLEGVVGSQQYTAEDGGTLLAPLGFNFVHGASDGAIYVGYSRGPELIEYSPEGVPVRRLELPIERQAMTRDDRAAFFERLLMRADPRLRPRMADVFLDTMVVDSFPSYSNLVTGYDGSVWVELHDAAEEVDTWLIVDPLNATARHAHLPSSELLFVTGDRAVVRRRDDALGREIVSVHRIR